jgi:hypothetical protein
MMRAKGRTCDGRPLLIIGLEAGNIERLKDGKPRMASLASASLSTAKPPRIALANSAPLPTCQRKVQHE